MKFSNILLMSGLSLAILVSSCKKDEEETAAATPPKIQMNGKTTGNIVEAPATAQVDGQMQGYLSQINQAGTFINILNSVPLNAQVTNRSTNSSATYYWTVSSEGATASYWYTVTENGNRYDVVFEIAYASPDLNVARSTYIDGWVATNGTSGDLTFHFDAFNSELNNYNYHYTWDTNASGDFHVLAYWNTNSSYQSLVYEAMVYHDGHGWVEYRYTLDTDNYVFHYDWNADWSSINYSYTINGVQQQ